MAHIVKFVVLLVWLVLSLHLGISFEYDPFDYFKLSMTWTPSFCRDKTCKVALPSGRFIIHGLWPHNYHSSPVISVPTFCYRVRYTPIEDQDLNVRLNINWPNLKDGRIHNHKVWAYAWNKHGTCALIWYYQMEYLDLALKLFDKFDVLAHLLEKGVVPAKDHTYAIMRIRLGIIELTTKEPDLYCQKNNQGVLQILEIRICYTPGGEIIDCEFATLGHTCSDPQVLFPRNPDPPPPGLPE